MFLNFQTDWMDLLVTDSAIEEEEDFVKSSYFGTSSRLELAQDAEMSRSIKSPARLGRQRRNQSRRSTRQRLMDAWDGEAVAQQIDQQVQEEKDKDGSAVQVPQKYNTSWVAQYRVLIHRALKNSRSAIFTPLNMIRSALLGTISGLLWFQLEYTEKTVHDRTSYFFFTMTYWVFDSMFGALLAFPSERKVILKVRTLSDTPNSLTEKSILTLICP